MGVKCIWTLNILKVKLIGCSNGLDVGFEGTRGAEDCVNIFDLNKRQDGVTVN